MSIPSPEPAWDYDSALRNRLQNVSAIGDQQNQYVQQQALAKQQAQVADQQNQLAAAQSAQNTSRSAPNSFYTPGQGQYTNTADAQSPNPRNAAQAIAYAKQAVASGDSGWYRKCLAFVAQAYGLGASGTPTAIQAWQGSAQKHTDRNPAVGSLVYWDTGAGRAGHVALYAGNGMIYSNDIGQAGHISYVPMDEIDKKWGAKYVGWSNPQFAASPKR